MLLIRMILCTWIATASLQPASAWLPTAKQCYQEAGCTGSSLSALGTAGESRLDGKIEELDGIERALVLSDLHTDHEKNMRWLKSKISASDLTKKDLIVIAGDISHDLETFRHSLEPLVRKTNVFFVPGNHEAWIDRRHKPNSTSLEKLDEIYEVCDSLGVLTRSVLVRNSEIDSCHPLWICPLESWYDGTLGIREEFCRDFRWWPWTDFRRCVWPPEFPLGSTDSVQARLPLGLVEFFLERNKPFLDNNPFACPRTDGPDPKTIGIMTGKCNTACCPIIWFIAYLPSNFSLHLSLFIQVSHFLPNKMCLPDYKDPSNPVFQDEWFDHGAPGISSKFAKVAGTCLLDAQIRQLLPSDDDDAAEKKRIIHVFGHSHRPKDFVLDNIRYIHNPLGKPRERELYMVSPDVDFQLVWDTRIGEVPGETIIRLWEEKGGGVERLIERLQKGRPRSRYKRH
jgi:predicted phosphodiesterase